MTTSRVAAPHPVLLTRARRLEHVTIAWNALEAAVALVAGALSGSIALMGFGWDSVIETASAAILLWHLRIEPEPASREHKERQTQRLLAVCFFLLAVYVTVQSVRALWTRAQPERSVPGIAIAIAAIIVMPLLAQAKRRVARELSSGALHSDSRQADFCAWLSAILLAGLLLNWLLGWWWADACAALVMAPIIAREAVQNWRGKRCACMDI